MKDGIKALMLLRNLATIVAGLFLMVVAAGCASTEITSRDRLVTERLPRPAHIWVYDFAATAADVPAYSALAGQNSEDAASQTAEHMETGQQPRILDEVRFLMNVQLNLDGPLNFAHIVF
jgi:hypothetical protein